jgi:hypothetical protein
MCGIMNYPKVFTVALKLGLILMFYSSILMLLSIVLQNSIAAVFGIILFVSGFSLVYYKIDAEERKLKKLKNTAVKAKRNK